MNYSFISTQVVERFTLRQIKGLSLQRDRKYKAMVFR